MRLKILVVPFLVIMILVLAIGYIQPDFDTIQMKKSEIAVQEAQVADIEAVLGNIDTLRGTLENQKETEDFVRRMVPQRRDQGRMIDAFNFLASQSGLLITDMKFEEIRREAPEEAPLVTTNAFTVSGEASGAGLTGSPVMSPYRTPLTQAYTATVTVRGTYENIKGFFDRVAHMDRVQKLGSFDIRLDKQAVDTDANGEPVANSGELIGTLAADFDYFPQQSLATALNVPVFLRSEFDTTPVEQALGRATSIVPVLEKPPTGRPNPFQ